MAPGMGMSRRGITQVLSAALYENLLKLEFI